MYRLAGRFRAAKTKQCSLLILQGFLPLWTIVNKESHSWLNLPIWKIITFKHNRIENGNVQIKRMYETIISIYEQAERFSGPKEEKINKMNKGIQNDSYISPTFAFVYKAWRFAISLPFVYFPRQDFFGISAFISLIIKI